MSKIKRILNQDVDIHSGNGNIADENTHFHVLQELSRFANDPYPRPLCTRVSNITRLWNAVVKNPGKSKYIVAAFLRLHRLTILTILDPDWKEVSCDLKEDLVDNINVCCNTLANMFERALDCRRELLSLANDPWGDRGVDWNKLVYGKLKFEDQGVRNFLDSESDEVILGRIHFLVAVDREHLALNLARYLFIHHSRRRTLAFENIENSAAESENKELYDYSSLANYQAALNWLTSLLQRRSLPDIIEDTMLLSCHEGILLIMCFQKRKTRDSLNIANELIKAFLVRDILYPKEYCCTKLLFQLWCSAMKNDSLLQVTSAVRELLGPTARNSAQFYLCADVFYSQFQGTFLPLYVELFIRGLTIDINFLEVLRTEKRKRQHKVNEIEIHISDMFDKFSTLFTDLNEVVERECVLSAFSLRPTKERLYILQNLTDHILSDGNFKSEWEKELNQSDPGCHKYSCGFNCSNVCMQRKKLFHPLLSKGIKNVPYSLVKDFVVVLEAVRCSTFQFDYFDWESAIKELSDYLEEYTKKSSQNRLLTDYDSDTEYASDESNSSVPHANRKLNDFKASASSSHQDVYQNGHHHEIAPISVESDCMGLPNASIPYVAETIEIETEGKNSTFQSSISNSVTPNNPKPDVEIHKNHNSNLRNEDPQSERSLKNYNEDFNDPGGIVKVPPQKVISNDSGTREFSSNNRCVPVSDQNSSDSSHYPSTLPSHLLKSKSVPERYPAPSNANRQNYSQENVIQGVSLTVSSPSLQRTTNKNVSTSNVSKPSHDAELCNDGSKKQFRYNNSPITVGGSSALEPLASTLEGLGSPYRLLHAMGAPNRVPEKRKLDHPVLPAGRISPFRKQLIKDPMQSYSSNKTLAGRFQHSDASVLKYVQLQCENQTSRNIVQSQTRTSQNPKIESKATTVTSLLDSCKIKTAITNASDFAARSPNILRRPNIAKVSPVVNHGGQKTAAISSLVPLPKDQNKISDNKSQNFCNRSTVIQHIQVQNPDTDKQATVPQPSTPVPPLNEVKNFKPGKPLSFKISGGAKWIRGPNGSGTPLYVKIMKPPDGKKILVVEKQTKERDGLEGNAAQSNNILKVSFTTNDKQHGSQKIVDMDINPSQLLDLFSNNSTPNFNQLPSEIICPSSSSGNLEPVNNIYSSPVTKSNSISSSSQVFNSWSGHSKQLYNSTHQSVNIPQQQKINSSSSAIQSQFSQDLTASKTDNAPSSLIKHGSFSVEQKNLACVPYSQQQVGNSESIVNPQTTLRSLLSNPPAVTSTSYAIQKSRVSASTTSLSSNVCTESFESYTASSAPKQQQIKSYVERAVVSSPSVNAKMEQELLPLTTSEGQYVSNNAAKSVSSTNSRNVSNCTVPSSPKPQQVKTFTNAPTSSVIHIMEGTKTPVSALELQCGSTNVTSSLSNFNSRNYSNYSRSQPLKQQPNANLGTRMVPTTYGNTSKERKVTSVPDLQSTLVSASTALKSIASPQPFANYIQSHSSEPQNSVLTESISQMINSTLNKETAILHVEVPTLPNKKTLSSNLHNSPIESPISSAFPTNPSMRRQSSLDLKPFGSDRNANPAISYGTTVMSSSSQVHSSVSNESTFSNPTTSFTNDVNATNLSFNTNRPSPNPINSFGDNRSATNLTSYITNKHPPSPEPSVISYGNDSNKTPSCSTMNGQKKFERPRSDRTVNSPYNNTVDKSNPIPASLNNDQTAVTPSYNIANKPPSSPLSFIFDDSGNSLNPYNDTHESFSDQRPSHCSNVNVMSPSSYVTNRSSFGNDSSLMSPPSYVKSRPSSNSSPFSANSNAMNPTSYSVTNNSLTQRSSFTSDTSLSPPYNVKNRPSSNPSSFTYNGNTTNATSYGTTKKSSSSSASSLNCDENARSPSYNINRPASNPLPPSFSIDKKSRKYWLPERPQSLANPSVLMPPLCCSPHEVDKCQSCKQSEMDRSSEAVVSNRNMSIPSGNPAMQASFHERSLYQQVKLEGQKLYPEQHVVGLSSKKRDEKTTPFRCRFCGKYLKTRHTHKMHELKQHINKTPKNHKSYTIPNSDVLPCNAQTQSLLEIVKVEPPDDFEVFNSETTREKNVQFENRGELDIILDQYSANTSLNDKMLEYFSDFSEPGISDSKVLAKSNPNLISEEVLPYPKINARIPSIPEQSITDPVTVNSIEHASSKPYDSNLCSVIKSSVPQEQQDNLNLEATAYDTELQSPWQVAGAAMRYLSDPSYANIDEQFFPDFQESFDRMAEEEASFKNDPKDVPSSPYPSSTHSSMSTTVASNSSIYQKNVPTTVNNFQMNDFFQSPRNQNLMDNGNWQHIEPKYFQHNCTTCQQAFASEEALQIHINNIHGSHVQMPGQPFYPYDNVFPDTPSDVTNLKTTPNYLMLRQDYDVQGNDSISKSKIVNAPKNNNNNLFYRTFDDQCANIATPDPCNMLAKSPFEDSKISSNVSSDKTNVSNYGQNSLILPPNEKETLVCEICSSRFPSYNMKQTHMEQLHGIYSREGSQEEINQPFNVYPQPTHLEKNNRFHTPKSYENNQRHEPNNLPSTMLPHDENYGTNKLPQLSAERRQPEQNEHVPANHIQPFKANICEATLKICPSRSRLTDSPLLASVLSSHPIKSYGAIGIKTEPMENFNNFDVVSRQQKAQTVKQVRDGPKIKRPRMNLGLSCPMCNKKFSSYNFKRKHINNAHEINWIESPVEYKEREMKEREYKEKKMKEKMAMNNRRTVMVDNTFRSHIANAASTSSKNDNGYSYFSNNSHISTSNEKKNINQLTFEKGNSMTSESPHEPISNNRVVSVSSAETCESPHPMPVLSPIPVATGIAYSSTASPAPLKMPEIDTSQGNKRSGYQLAAPPRPNNKYASLAKDVTTSNTMLNDETPPVLSKSMAKMIAKNNSVFMSDMSIRSGSDKYPAEIAKKSNGSQVPCEAHLPTVTISKFSCKSSDNRSRIKSNPEKSSNKAIYINVERDLSVYGNAPALEESSQSVLKPCESPIGRDQLVMNRLNKISVARTNQNSNQNATSVQFTKDADQLLKGKSLISQGRPPHIIHTTPKVQLVRPKLGYRKPTANHHEPVVSVVTVHKITVPSGCNTSETKGSEINKDVLYKELAISENTKTINTTSDIPAAKSSSISSFETNKSKNSKKRSNRNVKKPNTPKTTSVAEMRTTRSKSINNENDKEQIEESSNVENIVNTGDVKRELRSDSGKFSLETTSTKLVLKKINSSSKDSKFQCYVPKKNDQMSIESTTRSSSYTLDPIKSDIVRKTSECVVRLDRLMIAEKGVITKDKIEEKPVKKRRKRAPVNSRKRSSRNSKVQDVVPSPAETRSKRSSDTKTPTSSPQNSIGECKVLLEKTIPDQFENRKSKRRSSIEVIECPKKRRSDRNTDKPTISRKDRRRSCRLKEGCLKRLSSDHSVPFVILE